MAILQAILTLITRSAGRILNAIFGWAVMALFGRTSAAQSTLLSGVVAMAALWPVLLLGVAFPRLAVFVLTFVPAIERAPVWIVRVVWVALALLVPVIVGLAVAAKAPPGSPPESFAKRLLRGFPITLALAGAFVIMFVTVPLLRLLSLAKGWADEHVPLVTHGEAYARVAGQIDATLARHGIDARRADPAWWIAAPTWLLDRLGGKAFRGYLPGRLAFWRGGDLELALYPSDLLIRGASGRTAWTHGLLAEALARGPGLQTIDPEAQRVERQIHGVWAAFDEDPAGRIHSRGLRSRLFEIARECAALEVPYEEWQVVYRQTVQLGRALGGDPQLLDHACPVKEAQMQPRHVPARADGAAGPLASETTAALAVELASETSLLVRKEVELAKAELRADIDASKRMAMGLGVAGVFGLVAFTLLVVGAALSWVRFLDPSLCVLIAAGVFTLLGLASGLSGWASRVKKPLERTRRTLEDDVHWAKERIA